MEKAKLKIVGIVRDEKTGRPMTIMQVTIDNITETINTFSVPQCYGKWNEWTRKHKHSQCSECIFRKFCREDTIRKLVGEYEMRKYDYDKRNR